MMIINVFDSEQLNISSKYLPIYIIRYGRVAIL